MSLKPSEIRKMSKKERMEKLNELQNELVKLRMQARLGTIDNPGKIRTIKKSIARILTIEKEDELKNKKQ